MSDDALAALLQELVPNTYATWDEAAVAFRVRGVVVLPPDHPLRTGEPTPHLLWAIQEVLDRHHWPDGIAKTIGRAALAVLREPL